MGILKLVKIPMGIIVSLLAFLMVEFTIQEATAKPPPFDSSTVRVELTNSYIQDGIKVDTLRVTVEANSKDLSWIAVSLENVDLQATFDANPGAVIDINQDGLVKFEGWVDGRDTVASGSSETFTYVTIDDDGDISTGGVQPGLTPYIAKGGRDIIEGTIQDEREFAPDLSISLTSDVDAVRLGESFRVEGEIVNLGQDPTNSATILDLRGTPGGVIEAVIFIDRLPERGDLSDDGLDATYTFDGPIAAGESISYEVSVSAQSGSNYTLVADVDNQEDLNPNNDSTNVQVIFNPAVGLIANQIPGEEPYVVGEAELVSVAVTNNGSITATNVQITWSITQGTFSDGSTKIQAVFDSLAPGDLVSLDDVWTPSIADFAVLEAVVTSDNYETVTVSDTVEVDPAPAELVSVTLDPNNPTVDVARNADYIYRLFTVVENQAAIVPFSVTHQSGDGVAVSVAYAETVTIVDESGGRTQANCIQTDQGLDCGNITLPTGAATIEVGMTFLEAGDQVLLTFNVGNTSLIQTVNMEALVAPTITIDQYPADPVNMAACNDPNLFEVSDSVTLSGTITNPTNDAIIGQLLISQVDVVLNGLLDVFPQTQSTQITDDSGNVILFNNCGAGTRNYWGEPLIAEFNWYCPGNDVFGTNTFEAGVQYTYEVQFIPCTQTNASVTSDLQAVVRVPGTTTLLIPESSADIPSVPITYNYAQLEEIGSDQCFDGIDNDGDGLVDCADTKFCCDIELGNLNCVQRDVCSSGGDCNNDGICETDHGEDQFNCPADCLETYGCANGQPDGICSDMETPESCTADCGFCGDNYCSSTEDEFSCSPDCEFVF